MMLMLMFKRGESGKVSQSVPVSSVDTSSMSKCRRRGSPGTPKTTESSAAFSRQYKIKNEGGNKKDLSYD